MNLAESRLDLKTFILVDQRVQDYLASVINYCDPARNLLIEFSVHSQEFSDFSKLLSLFRDGIKHIRKFNPLCRIKMQDLVVFANYSTLSKPIFISDGVGRPVRDFCAQLLSLVLLGTFLP
jgi:hypothetical protein